MWWLFWWQAFCQISPGKIGLNFVTENFTTFFIPRQKFCHVQLTLGASSPIQLVEGATKCKGSTDDLYVGAEPFLHDPEVQGD